MKRQAFLLAVILSVCMFAPGAQALRFRAGAYVVFQDDCQDLVLREVRRARDSIWVAMYVFTNRRIADALAEARQRGVKVQVKLDRAQANDRYGEPIVRKLRRAGVSVLTVGMPGRYHMHHKFLVIDDTTVITGSYNFTVAASTENYENLVLIESAEIARRFYLEYQRIKTKKRAK